MPTLIEMREKRANIWEQAKALQATSVAEERDFTAEEQEQWDRAMADIDSLKVRIEREERAQQMDTELNSYQSRTGGPESGDPREQAAEESRKAYKAAFGSYLREGMMGLDQEQQRMLRNGYQEGEMSAAERRALTTLTGSAGGYTVPTGEMQPFTRALIDWGGMRRSRAQKLTTTHGREIPWPTGNDTGNTGRRITENTQVDSSGKDPSYGGKVLRAYIYTTDAVLVPFALLDDTEFALEEFLFQAFGERIGRIQNSEDTTGTGDSMPEGLVTAATVGKTASAVADIDFDELIDLELSVYGVYRQAAEWMFNSTTLGVLRKKVDNDGRPLWAPGVADRTPDRIWNYPYTINEDMADPAASAKTVAFGDMSAYKIRDVKGIQVLRLVERYADYGQVGFLAFHRHDAKLIDAGTHPIKVLQQAAS